MSTYEETVRQAVLGGEFTWVRAREGPIELTLVATGAVQPNEVVDRWSVSLEGSRACLRLYLQGQLLGSLFATSAGIWKGRERGGTGYQQLIPKELKPETWRHLTDLVRFTARKRKGGELSDKVKVPSTIPDYSLSDLVNRSKLPRSAVAVALIACDRYYYFQQVVASLAKNPQIAQLPVFLFLDENKDAGVANKHVKLCQRYIPQTVIVRRNTNYGCGRNIIDARRQLFTKMGYAYVYVFEDDMKVSPHYLGLTWRLMMWAEQHFDNVGAVQAWNLCRLPLKDKQQRVSEVHATYTNWWGYLMSRKAWQKIESDVLEYQNQFLNCSYMERDHQAIRTWFWDRLKNGSEVKKGRTFLEDTIAGDVWNRYIASPATGQDAITMTMFRRHGLVRLATTVNRGEYIGREGIQMTARQFVHDGFLEMSHETYAEDEHTFEFSPREDVSTPTVKEGISHVEMI
jgi:hypothetical protein